MWLASSPLQTDADWGTATGTGALPVMEKVRREATRRRIKLVILPTVEAIEELKQHPNDTNAILHITC
jgi:hypothetical protein